MATSSKFIPEAGQQFNIVCLVQYEPDKAQDIMPAWRKETAAIRKLQEDLAHMGMPTIKSGNVRNTKRRDNSILLWWFKQKAGEAVHNTLVEVLCTQMRPEDLQNIQMAQIEMFYLPLHRNSLPVFWEAFRRLEAPSLGQTSAMLCFPASPNVPSSPSTSSPVSEKRAWIESASKPVLMERLGVTPSTSTAPPLPKETSGSLAHRLSLQTTSVDSRDSSSLLQPPPPAFGIHFASLTGCLRLLCDSDESAWDWGPVARRVEHETRLLFEAEPDHRPDFSSDSPENIHEAILKALCSRSQRSLNVDAVSHSAMVKSVQAIDAAEKRVRDLQSVLEKEKLEHANLRSAHTEVRTTLAESQRIRNEVQELREREELLQAEMRDARESAGQVVEQIQAEVESMRQTNTQLKAELERARQAASWNRVELQSARKAVAQIQTELDNARQATAQSRAELERIQAEQSAPFLAPALFSAFFGITDIARVVSS